MNLKKLHDFQIFSYVQDWWGHDIKNKNENSQRPL